MRGERLRGERTEHAFKDAAQRRKPDHVVGVLRQQQVFHHVEDEQRAHPVVGEALPHLGGEQEGQPARMAEKIARGAATQRLGLE